MSTKSARLEETSQYCKHREPLEKCRCRQHLAQQLIWRGFMVAAKSIKPGCGYTIQTLHENALRAMAALDAANRE